MPPFLIVLLLAAVFTAALAVVQGLYWAYIGRQEQARRDLARRLGTEQDARRMNELFRERAADAAAQALGSIGAHLQKTLNAADVQYTVTNLLTRMAVVGGGVFVVAAVKLGPAKGLLVGFLAFFLPYLLVRRAGTKRTRAILQQLPDTLDLLARSLQAGVGLNDAVRMAAEEMPMPVAGEFARVFEEVRFGRDFREAAEGLVVRNPDIFDLRLFVSSLLLARETGGNLIEILDNISNTIRQRFLFDAKVRALTSEARFSALVLGSLPIGVGMIVLLLRPEYLSPLFTDPLGNLFLGYSLTSYSLGILIMRAVSSVEV